MENITLPIPSFIAKGFTSPDSSVKQKAAIYINAFLNGYLSNRPANERLLELMQKGSTEAKANGFTPEQLDSFLQDEN